MSATTDLALALDFIEQRFADELAGFDRYQHSVRDILDHLDGSDGDRRQQAAAGRQRRGVLDCFASTDDRVRFCRRLQTTACDRAQRRSRHQHVSIVRSVCSAQRCHPRRLKKGTPPPQHHSDVCVRATWCACPRALPHDGCGGGDRHLPQWGSGPRRRHPGNI